MRKPAIYLFQIFLLFGGPPCFGAKAPEWVESLRKMEVPDWARKEPAVVYSVEQLIDVSKSKVKHRWRKAVQPQATEGLRHLTLYAPQRIGEDFLFIGAWKVRPDGEVTRYNYTDVVQVDADHSYQFSMTKVNVLAPHGARVGDLIAWEYQIKAKPEAHKTGWHFVAGYPTLVSRFGIKLPDDWGFQTSIENHEGLESSIDENGYTVWEMRNLHPFEPEPFAVPYQDLVPTLLISYGPESGKDTDRDFKTWQSVARWYADIVASQVVSDPSISDEVHRAVAGSSDPYDRIRRITEFTQGVRYLDTAVGRSVAEPHPAPDILKNRYGDCEDKSVLTIAMLKEIGIDAYPVMALTKSGGRVNPDFPSLFFNHAIVAIRAPEGVHPPSTVTVDGLGNLIIFDPTDDRVGLGDLPENLQGTHALLAHPTAGDLVTLPMLPPEASRREAEVRIAFAPQGDVDVQALIKYTGDYAARRRDYYESVRGERRHQELLEFLRSEHGRVELNKFEVIGVESPGDPIVMDLEVRMPLPGKDLGILKTLSTGFLLGSRAPTFQEKERTTPLRFDAGFEESERTVIEIPEGWKLAGLPEPNRFSSAVGEYQLAATEAEGRLVVDRTLTVRGITVPPSDYPAVREFFQSVAAGDNAGIAIEKARGET